MRVPLPLATINFNRRPLTWRDFESLVDSENIVCLRVPLDSPGFYTVIEDYPLQGDEILNHWIQDNARNFGVNGEKEAHGVLIRSKLNSGCLGELFTVSRN